MKYTLLLFIFSYYFVDSCASHLTKYKRDAADFRIEFINDELYLVDQLRWEKTMECMDLDTSIFKLFSYSDELLLETFERDENILGVNRKVIGIGDFDKVISRKFMQGKNEYKLFHCINESGFVVASRLIKASSELEPEDLKGLLHVMNEYKYEFSNSGKCLQCAVFMFKVDI